ncbi:MAG: M20/M25/M40 family metallo-hydrolase [Anaerolineae bacterium]|nr:M20/M25/M40 family metallo-hydrolase [Anaerolineae bacterium]
MINQERLVRTFLELVYIDSPSGQEARISTELSDRLRALDLEVSVDEIGNVLGRWEGVGQPLLLSAHVDTVSPGIGIKPVVADGIIRSDGTTILGADDKSGVAVILEVLAVLHEGGQRPAVEVALSVGEEVGLLGAKSMDAGWFRARQALALDSGGPLSQITCAAPTSDKFSATIYGRAAHAGSNPEEGINAIWVASQAISQMLLGRIDEETTANIGVIRGGHAVNVVPDRVEIRGEARSHSSSKLDAQIGAMRAALENATTAHKGARLELEIERTYHAYRLAENAPIIQRVARVLDALGEEPPSLRKGGGGSDANILNGRGIEAVPISTGMQAVHTNEECIAIADMARCARFVLLALQRSMDE